TTAPTTNPTAGVIFYAQDGVAKFRAASGDIFDTTKRTVTGAKGGNAALTSLLAQLAAAGLITNNTTSPHTGGPRPWPALTRAACTTARTAPTRSSTSTSTSPRARRSASSGSPKPAVSSPTSSGSKTKPASPRSKQCSPSTGGNSRSASRRSASSPHRRCPHGRPPRHHPPPRPTPGRHADRAGVERHRGDSGPAVRGGHRRPGACRVQAGGREVQAGRADPVHVR